MEDLPDDLQNCTTEMVDERYSNLDLLATADMVAIMNEADHEVPRAVAAASPQIVVAIDAISAGLQHAGRLVYVGAGTAGRLGVLDASECPPTFSTDPSLVTGIIAGGPQALTTAIEGAEDDADAGYREIEALGLGQHDSVVGISASGRTPYVIGALKAARDAGTITVSIANNSPARISREAAYPIEVIVGPEVLSGSTRLKAGTAQKLVLNMISTLSMIKLGKAYGNLMVDVNATNRKLENRALNLVMRLADVDATQAEAALANADGSVKVAVTSLARGLDAAQARAILDQNDGFLRRALDA